MKALILNSGTGSRMGELTSSRPKCLLPLANGESIFARQLRILAACGMTEVIVTTGRYEQALAAESLTQPGLRVSFVHNPLYASTNYIYSMHLAASCLDDDILLLHGDLVFDQAVIRAMLADSRPSLCLVNKRIKQPPKDFKGRLEGECLREVSVDIFEDNCYALQPLYKLSKPCIQAWLEEIAAFVRNGNVNVYAEHALNKIAHRLEIRAMSYDGYYVREIDTSEDYELVSHEILMADRGVCFGIPAIEHLVKRYGAKKPFAVMGGHTAGSEMDRLICTLTGGEGRYFGVAENPSDASAADALQAFLEYGGDLLISIGGGSAIDTAKLIKHALLDDPAYDTLAHIAVPTTAGSGSEATHFAVVYRDGVKCSADAAALRPENAVLDSTLLHSLSAQQRKVSLLDALCHDLESLLSRNATVESRAYARYSLDIILAHYAAYAAGDTGVYEKIMTASHYAGMAIDISKTAIGHAMSYVLTSDYGIQHGQAAALCLIEVLRYVQAQERYASELKLLQEALHCREGESAADKLSDIYRSLHMRNPFDLNGADPETLLKKVNADRMGNSVIQLDKYELRKVYGHLIGNFSQKTSISY